MYIHIYTQNTYTYSLHAYSEISWTEHIMNEEEMAMIGEERILINTIRKRQRKWTV